jgi:hypothetical protein
MRGGAGEKSFGELRTRCALPWTLRIVTLVKVTI